MSYSNHPIFQRRRRLTAAWTLIVLGVPAFAFFIYDYGVHTAASDARPGVTAVICAVLGVVLTGVAVTLVRNAARYRTAAEHAFAVASTDLMTSDNIVADIEAADTLDVPVTSSDTPDN